MLNCILNSFLAYLGNRKRGKRDIENRLLVAKGEREWGREGLGVIGYLNAKNIS